MTVLSSGVLCRLAPRLQVELQVQQTQPHTATITSKITLQPTEASNAGGAGQAAVDGAGVSGFAGAHWFAAAAAEQVQASQRGMPAAAAAADGEPAGAASGGRPSDSAAAAGSTEGRGVVVPAAAAPTASASGARITITSTITVSSAGVVSLEWQVDASAALPAPGPSLPSLPRVGLHALVSGVLRHVTWYGMGPQECYPDRQAAARLAQHSM